MLSIIGKMVKTSEADLPLKAHSDVIGHLTCWRIVPPEDGAYDPKVLLDSLNGYSLPGATVQVGFQSSKVRGLAIQAIDAYGYQREFTLLFGWEPGQSHHEAREWRWSAYKHPFRPSTEGCVSSKVARTFIERLVELVEQYPTLLFNEADDRRPRGNGFVHVHEQLLYGCEPSATLLP